MSLLQIHFINDFPYVGKHIFGIFSSLYTTNNNRQVTVILYFNPCFLKNDQRLVYLIGVQISGHSELIRISTIYCCKYVITLVRILQIETL